MKEKNIKISVIGGDLRQVFIANELAKSGYSVSVFASADETLLREDIKAYADLREAAKDAFLTILPIPLSRDGKTLNAPAFPEKIFLEELFEKINDSPYIALGIKTDMQYSGESTIIDYAKGEDFALGNAYLTAEAALSVIIKELPCSLRGSVCAISGYGRIAKFLSTMLISLGARVKIFARKKVDRISAELCGAKGYNITEMADNISDVDILINTVPAVIIDKKVLASLHSGVKIIELASLPGGVDKNSAAAYKTDIINTQSLPGKYSPKSAAKVILESIFASLSELEVSI